MLTSTRVRDFNIQLQHYYHVVIKATKKQNVCKMKTLVIQIKPTSLLSNISSTRIYVCN